MKKPALPSWLSLLVLLSLPACMSGGLDASGDSGGQAPYPGDGTGGGNVGFGGAQDIGLFRDILNRGEIPGENTLDANGFFSEHYTELPPPDCGQTICVQSMLAVGRDWMSDQYQATLQIALNTPIDPTTLERLPLNLVVVVDTSGSMAEENRIGYARDGLHLLIDELQDGDRLALISYNSGVETLADLSGELDRAALHAAVDSLEAGGPTNLFGGLQTGFQLGAAAYDTQRQNRVILVSDGLPTSGNTSESSILAMAETFIAEGIGLTTIGVGTDFNIDLMRGLAERGAGNFYFVEDADAITEVFVDEVDFFVTPLAVAVDIEVVPGQAYRLGEVVGTRLWNTQGEIGRMYIPGVFVASRTSQEPDPSGRRGGGSTLFIDMTPREGQFSDLRQVAQVRLTYRMPGSSETFEQLITVNNPSDPGVPPDEDIYLSHQAMAENYAMYNIYLGLRAATRAAVNDYYCALALLIDLDAEIAEWNGEFEDPDIAADHMLVQQFIGNLEELGARPPDEYAGEVCSGYYPEDDYPYPEDEGGPYGDDEVHYYYGCAISGGGSRTGGGLGGLAVLFLAVVLASRRRSR